MRVIPYSVQSLLLLFIASLFLEGKTTEAAESLCQNDIGEFICEIVCLLNRKTLPNVNGGYGCCDADKKCWCCVTPDCPAGKPPSSYPYQGPGPYQGQGSYPDYYYQHCDLSLPNQVLG